jgi:hypothetical protein
MITVPEWYNASLIVDRNLETGREDKVAIYSDDEVSYGELARRINRFGRALREELGVRQEDRVLLVLDDTPSFPTAFFAAMRIGAIPVPVNTLVGADEYRFYVEDSRARIVVADGKFYDKVRDALRGVEEPVGLVLTNGREEGAHILEDLLEAGDDELSQFGEHRQPQGGGPPAPRHRLHVRDLRAARAGDRGVRPHVLDHEAVSRLRVRQRHVLPLLGRSLERPPPRQTYPRGGPGDHQAIRADPVLFGAHPL